MSSFDPMIDVNEVAEMCGMKPRVVRELRYKNGGADGPAYFKFNRITFRYRLSDVEAWIESRRDGGAS